MRKQFSAAAPFHVARRSNMRVLPAGNTHIQLRLRRLFFVCSILSTLLYAASFADAQPAKETTPVKYLSDGSYAKRDTTPAGGGFAPKAAVETRASQSYRLNEEGVELVFKGRKEDGELKIKEAIDVNPENATAMYNLAGLELANSRPDAAIALMEKALSIRPKDCAFLNRLAESHFANSDINRAVENYEKIVALDPGFGEAMLRLGTLYGMRRDWPKAESTLRRAVELHPKDVRALANLGNILILREKFQDAVNVLKTAQTIKPAAENAVAMGIAYEAMKNNAQALSSYRRAQELGDKDPELARHVLELAGEKPPAVTEIPAGSPEAASVP